MKPSRNLKASCGIVKPKTTAMKERVLSFPRTRMECTDYKDEEESETPMGGAAAERYGITEGLLSLFADAFAGH